MRLGRALLVKMDSPYRKRVKHGRYYTPEYKAWAAMKQRCTNPNHPRYPLYGARGITVCQRWLDSFQNFFDDLGPRPDGYELDKIDNDLGYSPENCRWTTKLESRRNRRGWVIRKAYPLRQAA